MQDLIELRIETDALRGLLRELAEVLATDTSQPIGVRDQLTLVWKLADGVVQANELFMSHAAGSAEMTAEFLEITRGAQTALGDAARMVEEVPRVDVNGVWPLVGGDPRS